MRADSPPRDDGETTTSPSRRCPICATSFPPNRRQAYCTNACRQIAWRRRHGIPAEPVPPPAARSRRAHTIYHCDGCDTRYLAEQWCPDCNRPCRRLGPGGECGCGELLTVDELLDGGAMA